MEITLVRKTNTVVVDGVAKQVSLENLVPAIDIIHWDTVTRTGEIQYSRLETEQIQDRDLQAEAAENTSLAAENQPPLEKPIYRTITIPRRNTVLSTFDYQPYYDAWLAVPEPVQVDPAVLEAARQAAIAERNADGTDTLGAVEPKTVAELRAMTRVQLRAWFDTNVTTAAAVRLAVRWIFIYLIRRF